jgi:3-oxoacyl-[acyl-carrier-protein] synthase II
MESRRVVVTGMGVVAPSGIGVENFWDSLVHGQSGIRRITHFDASSYPCQLAAEVPDFDPTRYMDPKTARRLARFAQFAFAASRLAVEDSKLNLDSVDPYSIGVVIGTGIGGGDCIENQHSIFMEKGITRLSPFGALMICTHSASGIVSSELGLKGPSATLSSACNSGLDAIASAYTTISLGDADMMVTGAGEAPITPFIVGLFCANGVLVKNTADIQNAVKPFDINGNGTILGEGGAVVILEELQHALKRKAPIYGEMVACASGHEGYDLFSIAPTAEAACRVMRKALMKAGMPPGDIEYINAHGNGLSKYDLNETCAIREVFGDSASGIPVTSIKPITGQSFAVAGILQMITCLLVMTRSMIPPTLNHSVPNSGCNLDHVPLQPRRRVVNSALMNARGFGGSHTSVIVRKLM